MGETIAAAVGIAIVCVVRIARFSRPATVRSQAHTFARKVDLALDPATESVVAPRLARREKAGALGGMLLAAATLLAFGARSSEVPDVRTNVVLLGVAGFLAGHAAGFGVVAWLESRQPVDVSGPRLARASTPMLDDYVARHERIGSWVLAGVSALVAIVLVVLDATAVVDLGVIPWAAVLAAVLVPAAACVLVEVVARRLVTRRQVATTTLDLAWDDALRARTLRDVVTVPLVAGCYAPLVLLVVVSDQLEGGWPANPAVGVISGIVGVLVLGLVVMAVTSLVLRPERHFRRRLWPQEVRAGHEVPQ